MGMPVEWSYSFGQPAYSETVDTAIRVVSGVLRQNEQAVLQLLRKGVLETGKEVRCQLVKERKRGQINTILPGTDHVLRRWEDEAIPAKAQKVPLLAELVSESESELVVRVTKRDLNALLQARRWRGGAARQGKSPSCALSPSQATGASKPDPQSTGSGDPRTLTGTTKAGEKVSPRTELCEIAKQTEALEEEKRCGCR